MPHSVFSVSPHSYLCPGLILYFFCCWSIWLPFNGKLLFMSLISKQYLVLSIYLINKWRCPCELIIFCLKICLWLSVILRITSTSCAWQSKPLQAVLDHVSSLPLNCFQYSVDFYNSLPLYLHFLCLEYIILHPPTPMPCLWPGPFHLVNFHIYCKPTVNVMFLWSLESLFTCLTKYTYMIVLWMPLIHYFLCP